MLLAEMVHLVSRSRIAVYLPASHWRSLAVFITIPRKYLFKVICNVCLFTSYSIDSNLQDEIASQDGVKTGESNFVSYILNYIYQ